MTCPVCGTVTVPGARFCHNCGASLPRSAAAPAAERRVVTVLFGDLSEFTAWAEGVDPERVGAVTDRVLAALAGAVKTFGGHVDKLTGDGIMAVFGAPVTHEDDPERAVRAALAMQRAVRRVLDDERGGGVPAGLRIGINTGDVVAGVQASLEYTVVGDTVNTAARLADSATVGTVYAGAVTSSATRHVVAWRRLLPLRLKGKRHAVDAYELLGPLDAPGTRSGLGDEAPFVGREVELGLVASRLAEVIDRAEPRALVLTADAGLGKSRFAAEAARLAASYERGGGGGARVLSVRCAAFGERWRLGPLSDLVRTAIGLPDQPGAARAEAEERLRRIIQILHQPGCALLRHTEPLLALLGHGAVDASTVDGAVQMAKRPPPVDLIAGAGQPVAVAEPLPAPVAVAEPLPAPVALAELLSALARDAPLLVVVDDLHAASPDTVATLGATLHRLTGPVLVVLLGRPELVRSAGALTGLADAEVHALAPLRGADTARLLRAHLGGGRLPPAARDQLLATAQGNPFYLSELVTLLLERGDLVRDRDSGDWRLEPESLAGRLLSRDLAAVLAARIDAVPADARAVLRDAAVVGDTVPAGALRMLRQQSSDPRPAAAAVELDRAIGELLHRRMLLPVRGGYTFATPLMREAAYAGVGKADLADRHAHLARWAVAEAAAVQAAAVQAAGARATVAPAVGLTPLAPGLSWTPETLDAFVADQVERAAALADAVSLRPHAPARSVAPLGVAALARLARRAVRAGEPGQAVRFAERAAALAGDTLAPADRLVHASALLQLGRPAAALAQVQLVGLAGLAGEGQPGEGPPDEARPGEARPGSREFGGGEPDDGGASPADRARALLLAGRAYRALGDPERTGQAWQEAVRVSTAAGLSAEHAEALRRIGMEEYRRGRLGEARSRFQTALEIAQRSADRRGQAWALQNLAWVATTLGDFALADGALGRAARLFAELGHVAGRAWLRGTTAFARLLAGRLGEARRLANAFLPFGERVGERWAVGTLRAVEAFAAAELGDLAGADRQARRAYRDFAEIDDDWGRGFALVVRGVVARGLAEREHAVDLLTDARKHGEQIGHPLLIGIAGTVRGFALLELGDPAGAEADAHAVLSVVKSHDVAEAARVGPRVLLGCARLAQGDVEAALGVLAEVARADLAPSVLLSRRHAVAQYASALLAAGRLADALAAARRAVALPAEDVRSGVAATTVLARSLAAAGDVVRARSVATRAVRAAYASQQVSERAAADAVRAALVRSGPGRRRASRLGAPNIASAEH